MPEVRNCRRCGKIYTHLGGEPLCPACKQADEEDFKKVKDYLYRNPGASMALISKELDISVEKIRRYLREGRLEIVGEEGNMFLECEMCGKSIKSGRLCEYCEKDLAKEFKSTASQLSQSLPQSPSRSHGLRYLHKETSKDNIKKK